ncbi:MAG: nucleotidyltransferase domain-containing protein [bacterium]
MKEDLQAELSEITQRMVEELKPEKIILFGSYARGTPNEDSDLDILVIVSQSNESPTKRATRAYHCLRGLPMPKDILVYTQEEVEKRRKVHASLISQVLEEGKVIYEGGQKVSFYDIKGVGKEVWEGVDAQRYVNQERASWDEKETIERHERHKKR